MHRFLIAGSVLAVGLLLYAQQCQEIRADSATQAAYVAVDAPPIAVPGVVPDEEPQGFVQSQSQEEVPACTNGACQKGDRVVTRRFEWRERRERRFRVFPLFRRWR